MPLAIVCLSLIAIKATRGVRPQPSIVFTGSGGCDSPEGCREDPSAERILAALELLPTGELVPKPELALPLGGLPVWLETVALQGRLSRSTRCLFATLANTSVLAAFAKVGESFELASSISSHGVNPVFAMATMDKRHLLVANYKGPDDGTNSTGASAASFRIQQDCSLTFVDNIPHSGHSVNAKRQGQAHVHSFVAARDGLAYACDLGLDMIFAYEVNVNSGKITELSRTATPPGAGPRHLVVHPTKSFVYVVHEMGQFIGAYQQGELGALTLLEIHSLVGSGASGEGSKAAEIVISHDGTILYATNRGLLNTVTVFEIGTNGTLTQKQQLDVSPLPRGMILASKGSLLLVASQVTGHVTSYHVGDQGLLTPTGFSAPGAPHSASFAEISEGPVIDALFM